jgi:hypothetical protein
VLAISLRLSPCFKSLGCIVDGVTGSAIVRIMIQLRERGGAQTSSDVGAGKRTSGWDMGDREGLPTIHCREL